MQKIPIIITNGKSREIIEELKKSDFDLDKINISESKRGLVWKYKIRLAWFYFFSSIKFYFQRIKELIRYRRLEPTLGGGSFGIESFYGFIFNLFATIIMPGVAFDIIKIVIKKSYKHLKTPKRDFILIVSQPRQPFDCRVKILIPNDLSETDLDNVLYQASELFTNLDKIRNYFGNKEIIAQCYRNFRWKIKFK
ncbi:MAG: hypothetical protein Q7S77_01795 [Candidatus Staskawiczbacteria bacterium]|nr:hypothetical protein [Candidatus Staskawiczbacteria bacterium]